MRELQDKRIFIVEDNPMNRVIFQMALLVSGAHLQFERWGRDVLYELESFGDVDLILLDLTLPSGFSGYDLFSAIRSRPEYDHVPIVAVSAAEPSIAIPKTRAHGFSGFISKPIDEELLPRQLAYVLQGERLWVDGTLHHE